MLLECGNVTWSVGNLPATNVGLVDGMPEIRTIPEERGTFIRRTVLWDGSPHEDSATGTQEGLPSSLANGLAGSFGPERSSTEPMDDFQHPRIAIKSHRGVNGESDGHGGRECSGAILSLPWHSAKGNKLLEVEVGSNGGTVELWNVDQEKQQLRLSAGYFGPLLEFRRISALTRFGRGSGLPGRVWLTQQPLLLTSLSESQGFLRAAAAREVHLDFGLGLPIQTPFGFSVVVFLSCQKFPIARTIDVWATEGGQLQHLQNFTAGGKSGLKEEDVSRSRELVHLVHRVEGPVVQASPSPEKQDWAWPTRQGSEIRYVTTLIN